MNSSEKDLDCTNASRGIWLVKVPKYISSRLKKASPLSEVGRLRISKSNTKSKPDIFFTLTDDLVNVEPAEKITKEHSLLISDISHQSLAVFSQQAKGHDDNNELRNSHSDGLPKLVLEGHVVLKGECRPSGDDRYMQLKRESIMKASQPTRSVKQLDKVVQNYKPVADHKHNIEFEQKKKAEGKKSREDKDKVMDMLFAAFEKHQYYNIKDLEKITRQPLPYLKEILKEICNYNAKNPHKNMWELKPEYRHYKDTDGKM